MSGMDEKRIKWTRRVKKIVGRQCPKCGRIANIYVFEGVDSCYFRCTNFHCDAFTTNETFHRLVEADMDKITKGGAE